MYSPYADFFYSPAAAAAAAAANPPAAVAAATDFTRRPFGSTANGHEMAAYYGPAQPLLYGNAEPTGGFPFHGGGWTATAADSAALEMNYVPNMPPAYGDFANYSLKSSAATGPTGFWCAEGFIPTAGAPASIHSILSTGIDPTAPPNGGEMPSERMNAKTPTRPKLAPIAIPATDFPIQQQPVEAVDPLAKSVWPSENRQTPPQRRIHNDAAATPLNRQNAVKLFTCGDCGRQYCRKSTLKAHQKSHMGAEKQFICEACGKTFTQAANLTAHRRVHTGEKPYTCEICLRQFSQSSSLVTHRRTHTGHRPYPCRDCTKCFTDSSTLTKHLRTHTGQKPYICEICMMRFSQSGNLHRHMKTHRMGTRIPGYDE